MAAVSRRFVSRSSRVSSTFLLLTCGNVRAHACLCAPRASSSARTCQCQSLSIPSPSFPSLLLLCCCFCAAALAACSKAPVSHSRMPTLMLRYAASHCCSGKMTSSVRRCFISRLAEEMASCVRLCAHGVGVRARGRAGGWWGQGPWGRCKLSTLCTAGPPPQPDPLPPACAYNLGTLRFAGGRMPGCRCRRAGRRARRACVKARLPQRHALQATRRP